MRQEKHLGPAAWTPMRWRTLFRRRWAAVLTAGLLALVGSAAVTAWRGVMSPASHDEASYLLAADTFLHGRLANPTHPFWQHFEAFQVLQQPTYASKYPPGQGLLLALGELLVGHPIAGSWLGAAAMAAAVCWMLAGFLPARWALFGTLLTTVQVGPATYWVQGYWCACLPAAGGALVVGAVPRLRRHGRTRDAIVLAVGLVVLANTRPFEGLLVALLAAAVLAPWFLRRDGAFRRRCRRVALPVAVLLAAAGAAMAVYNKAVTGDPWLMPYTLYERQTSGLPLFLWQERKPAPEFHHEIERRYYEEYLLARYERQRTLRGWLAGVRDRIRFDWVFYFGPFLGLLWLAAPWIRRTRGARLAFAGVGLYLLAGLVTSPHHAHYSAPLCGLAFLALTAVIRRLAVWLNLRSRRRWGTLLAAGLLLACAADRIRTPDLRLALALKTTLATLKPQVSAELAAAGGRQLILMRRLQKVPYHDDWVANGADIDHQRIVWARSMGPERDRELVEYYGDSRQAYLADLESHEGKWALRITPFDAGPP